jgi:hypothetical protein
MEFAGTVAPGAPRKPEEPRAPVLDPGRRKTKTGDFWAIVSDDRGHGGADPPIVMFHYAPGRGAVHARRFLEDYRGRFVQCDGCDVYDKLTKVDRPEGPWTLVHCWTHARRRFVKRLENDGSPIAEEALRQIAELYAIEKTVRGSAPEARLAARRELSAPIIEAFHPWLAAQLSRIPKPSNPSPPTQVLQAGRRHPIYLGAWVWSDAVPGRRPPRTGHQPGRKSDPKHCPDPEECPLRGS